MAAVPPAAAAAAAPVCSAGALLTTLAMALLNETLRSDLRLSQKQGATTTAAQEYDYIVVGAGAGGSVVAARLSEEPRSSVLLLEAGASEHPDVASYGNWYGFVFGTTMLWDLRSEPQRHSCGGSPSGCRLPVGKGLGGSSAINGMQYVRDSPEDLDRWAALDNPSWAYKDVLPYFIKSENNSQIGTKDPDLAALEPEAHGQNGPLPVERFPQTAPLVQLVLGSLRDAGLQPTDVNSRKQAGYDLFQSNVRNARRVSANLAFLQPVMHRPNLRVLTHSHVTKVLLDDSKRAYAVEYRDAHGNIRRARARREVVLSAGAVYSAQLLMLSGIGPARQLRQLGIPPLVDLPVGESFHDMAAVMGGVRFSIPERLHTTGASLEDMVKDMTAFLRMRTGPFASNTARRTVAFFEAADPLGGTDPDIQLRFQTVNREARARDKAAPGGCADASGLELYHDALISMVVIQGTKSKGAVRLRSADPFAAPLVRQNFYAENEDLIKAVRALRFTASLNSTDTFRKNGIVLDTSQDPEACARLEHGSDSYFECLAKELSVSTGHLTSSCPMGPRGSAGAVVSSRLQVHGVQGLRVVDAAVMPLSPRASTYATTLMIAEKAADMIKEDWAARDKD